MIEKNLIEFLAAIEQNIVQVINTKENEIANNINEYCKNPLFYSLSTEKIKGGVPLLLVFLLNYN